ncbi:MAG: ParB/RepB/Spo0J family partition protein [Planctomycetes bacterium]|nr:ParB/RepB/Spo0J family partition protein [Planctomycetota bacterium]
MIQKLPAAIANQFVEAPVDQIAPDPRNPRLDWDEAKLQKLADSMKREQVLQPILIRKMPEGDGPPYQIVFGERRWRAAKVAGWGTLPARIVSGMSDSKALVLMGEENLNRQNWTVLELAYYTSALNASGLTWPQVAKVVGKSKNYVSQVAKLTKLPKEWQQRVARREVYWGLGMRISPHVKRPEALEAFEEDFQANPSDWSRCNLTDANALVRSILQRLEAPEPAPTPAKAGYTVGPNSGGSERRSANAAVPPGELSRNLQGRMDEAASNQSNSNRSLSRRDALALLEPHAKDADALKLIRSAAYDLLRLLKVSGESESTH